jgi:hypothetical protein
MHDSSSFIGWRRWNFLLSLLLLATTRGNGVADSISSEATDELSGGGGEVSCATGAVSWVAAPVSSGSSPGLAVTGALGAQPVGSEKKSSDIPTASMIVKFARQRVANRLRFWFFRYFIPHLPFVEIGCFKKTTIIYFVTPL